MRKFTGHERDLASLAGTADDLDYMHARHHSPLTARFYSFDPIGGNPWQPQSWNRYAYALDRPLVYTDPLGLFAYGPGMNYALRLGWANVVQDYYYGQGVFAETCVSQFNAADRLFFASAFFSNLSSLSDGPKTDFSLSLGDRLLSSIDAGFAQTIGNAVVGFGDIVSFGFTELYRVRPGLKTQFRKLSFLSCR